MGRYLLPILNIDRTSTRGKLGFFKPFEWEKIPNILKMKIPLTAIDPKDVAEGCDYKIKIIFSFRQLSPENISSEDPW